MNTEVKMYDLIIYIGRFQPFHNAHRQTINKASDMAQDVLVMVGSASTARSPKNPWTYDERRTMINDMPFDTWSNVGVAPINDNTYNDAMWIQDVGATVDEFVWDNFGCKTSDLKIGVIGHDKDHSSFYLNFFPQWEYIGVPAFPTRGETIDATKIRNLMFGADYHFIKGVVPVKVFDMIERFSQTDDFTRLQKEWVDTKSYIDSWKVAPYAPTFVTVDSVVVQSGHVLLVQRGGELGYGLWAMAGGFIDPMEKLRDASVRELREETKLKVPKVILEKSISDKDTEVFDNPSRSARGRTITHCFMFLLDDAQKLPKVKGSDDAMDAKWFSFSDFAKMENQMFEDHYHIVKHMLAKIGT